MNNKKSELIEDFFAKDGIFPFVQTCGSGLTTDRLFGGTDLRHFIGESPTGKVEYLVENSFMNHEYVVFEELFDAPDHILEQLKDILSSGVFRNGSQIFPIKCKTIICATNRTRESFHKGNSSLKALMERFPLENEVKWKEYNSITYANLLNRTVGKADAILLHILESFAKSQKIISPRIAIKAAELIEECGQNCLKYIAEFQQDKKILEEAIKSYELVIKYNKEKDALKTKASEFFEKTYKELLEKGSGYSKEEFDTVKEEVTSLTKAIDKFKGFSVKDDLLANRTEVVNTITKIVDTANLKIKELENTKVIENTLDALEDFVNDGTE